MANSNCRHINTKFHYDNPSRFTCSDCGAMFIDYGKGYEVAEAVRVKNAERDSN